MKLDPDYTAVLLVGGKSVLGFKVSPVLDGVALSLKEQLRILGMLLDTSLLLDKQVARSAFYQLRLVSLSWPENGLSWPEKVWPLRCTSW